MIAVPVISVCDIALRIFFMLLKKGYGNMANKG
jgi:hypothetical protein